MGKIKILKRDIIWNYAGTVFSMGINYMLLPIFLFYFDENTLFFDIECTGLSPRKSFIYLIGYDTRCGNDITITQLLAKNESEEIEILTEFEHVMESFDKLLGFNSTRFDESFIVERCRKYNFATKIKSKNHIDMYLRSTKARCLLDLPNYKQKTIEEFLGLHRDDKYNGGELIPVYQHYSLMNDEKSKELILLHNFEDVKGMIFITDILAYPELLTTDLRYLNHTIEDNKLRFEIETDLENQVEIQKIRNERRLGESTMFFLKPEENYVNDNLKFSKKEPVISDFNDLF